jgi:penicillin amidase
MARVIGAIVSLIVGLGALVFIGLGVAVNGSLPRLEGRTIIAGLEAPVAVDRDVEGVPTLAGQNRRDVARALGYLHAQERYFQMDLMRRRAAGLLAELFGEPALAWDRRVRAHQLGHTAGEIVAALPTDHRALIDAYVEGVNAGLEDLDTPPVEYLLLRTAPEPWTAEDVILVVHAMFLELTPWGGEGDLARATMQEIIPPEVTAFLGPTGSEFDAPVEGEPLVVPPMPGPDVMDLRAMAEAAPVEDAPQPGSNAWAVAGSRTAHGGALLANDMHLGLGVPNTWYRVRMQWSDDAGAEHDVVGVTLPGAPLLIVGSTGRIAWGFTNSYIDTSDAVVLAMVGPDIYESPDGPRPFELRREVFQVAGGDPVEVDYPWTEWGPVVGEDHRGRPVVVRWTAHFPEAVNLNLQQLETAANVDEALAIAGTCGIPPQNLVVADLGGRVGWTVAGQVPRRVVDLDGTSSWDGWLTPDEVPRIADPADGLIWTANARVVGGEALDLLGDGGYALGSRAGQIRDGLRSLEQPAEAEMLALQLDDRALFLEWWRQHLLALLDDAAIDGHPLRAEARRLIEAWSGRAAVDDPGYRLVRGFRLYARSRVLEPLTAPCAAVDSPVWLGVLRPA